MPEPSSQTKTDSNKNGQRTNITIPVLLEAAHEIASPELIRPSTATATERYIYLHSHRASGTAIAAPTSCAAMKAPTP